MKYLWKKSAFYRLGLICFILTSQIGCKSGKAKNQQSVSFPAKKVGVLLVNHGSRSETWRKALMDLEKNVRSKLLSENGVQGIKTAHMEYSEPSMATRLKEFDQEGYSDIIIVPVFLTVSPHTFDDIPTIIGQKDDAHSRELLSIENIERYTPKARVQITPNLDFSNILKHNVSRRVKALSKNPEEEGVVLIGYGDETYENEWIRLFEEVGSFIQHENGMGHYTYGWCGHIAHYDPRQTTLAVEKVLKLEKKAIVIPVLVAHDEMFQVKIIGEGIQKVKDAAKKVSYKPDAILPDEGIETWVINIVKQYADKIPAKALSEK